MEVTKDIALTLKLGDILYHRSQRNSRNEPVRCRVNGKCQTWKTRPDDFRVPTKVGLYGYGSITEVNCCQWLTTEPQRPTQPTNE